MIDTGLSYALAPAKDINSIVLALSSYGVKCLFKSVKSEALNFLYCSIGVTEFADLPSIQIKVLMKQPKRPELIDTVPFHYLDLTPNEYFLLDDSDSYRLLISPSDEMQLLDGESGDVAAKWIVGDQFLQNYYSIFDFEHKRIGLIEATKDHKIIARNSGGENYSNWKSETAKMFIPKVINNSVDWNIQKSKVHRDTNRKYSKGNKQRV